MSKYADDVVIVLPILSENVESFVKHEIDNVNNWCQTHGLSLNSEKTKCLFIKRTAVIFSPSNVDVVDHLMILGAFYNADLTRE